MRQRDAHETRIAERCVLAAILLAALAFRLTWIAYSDWRALPDDDAFRYDFAAHALAQGKGYIHLNGEPTAFWPPGYSLILSSVYTVFGYGLASAQALNVVLALASVCLVYLIGRRLLGVPAALAAAAIVACFPSLVFFTNMTLSEVTFTWLALLAVYLVVRDAQQGLTGGRLSLAVAGLLLGFASLTRGQALLMPLAFIPFWLRSGMSRAVVTRKLALLALGMAILVGAWTVRNTIEMHAPVLISTNSGIDFWQGNNAGANGTYSLVHRYVPPSDYSDLPYSKGEARISNAAFRDGLSFAVTHPRREVVLAFRKLYWLYYKDDEGVNWNEAHGGRRFLSPSVRGALLKLSNDYYYAVLGMCVIGIAGPFSARAASRSLLVALLAYWTLVHLAFFGDPRFHAPALPVMALLAGVPLQALFRQFASARSQ